MKNYAGHVSHLQPWDTYVKEESLEPLTLNSSKHQFFHT